MDLEEHIRQIRLGIEARQFANEAAVSQGIVLRLLGALSWPCWDTHVVALHSIPLRVAELTSPYAILLTSQLH